jgi:tetratricopeptide (TPR) repeat protein
MALSTAREIGHVRLEYTVLCNLGIVLAGEGRLAEAATYLEKAIEGAIGSSDVRAEGQTRGYLALVLAKQGALQEARAMADRGEKLLVASADALSHALLLCDRAEIELLASATGAAEAAMQRARKIADEIECGPESELRRRLAAIGATQVVR